MTRITLLAVCLLSGCIFGSDDPPEDRIVINNDSDNNPNSGTNNTDDALVVSSATVNRLECTPNSSGFIVPNVTGEHAIRATSAVAYSGQTAVVGTEQTVAVFVSSLAWASVSDSELLVSVGGFVPGNMGPERYYHAKTSIAEGAEIYSLDIEPKIIEDIEAGAVLWEVTAATSEGVKECLFGLPDAVGLDLVGDCSQELVQSILTGEEVFAAETFDLAPLLEPRGGDYRTNLSSLSAVVSASGAGPGGDDYLGLVFINAETGSTPIGTSAAIDSSVPAPEIFAARLAWGVSRKEGGWPALQVLARNPAGEDYRPRVLVRGENGYVADDALGEWALPADLTPTSANFTFLDGYDAVASAWEGPDGYTGGIDFDPDQSTVKHGYAALNADGALVFARPGGLLSGEVDLIQADIGERASELSALRNIPVNGAQEAFPVLVVSNDEQNEFAIVQWDFSETVEVLPEALGGQFDLVRGFATPTLLDSRGAVLAFLGTKGDDVGIGLFPFTDDSEDAPTFRASICSDI